MRWKHVWTGALAAGFALMAGAVAFAHTDVRDTGNKPFINLLRERMNKVRELQDKLNLTEEQKKQMKQAIAPYRSEMRTAMRMVIEKRRALADITTSDSATEASIRKASDELAKAVADASIVGNKIHGAIKPLLTPWQVEKLKEFKEQNRAAVNDMFQDSLE